MTNSFLLFAEELLFDPETRKTTIEKVVFLWGIVLIFLKWIFK
jgi:hypothetical protein